jgi:hypothetical protein
MGKDANDGNDAEWPGERERLAQFLEEMVAGLGRTERRRWGTVYVRGLLGTGWSLFLTAPWRLAAAAASKARYSISRRTAMVAFSPADPSTSSRVTAPSSPQAVKYPGSAPPASRQDAPARYRDRG